MDCCNGTIATSLEDDDSSFDRVTQMLPECFVSVKLENTEDCCEKLNNPPSSIIPYSTPQFYSTQNLNASVMQNLQQHSVNSGCGGPAPPHCFHHHQGTAGMHELPPWLSHCYTAQMTPDCTQQVAQHFHSQSTYLTHETPMGPQGERVMKSRVGSRCENSNVSSGIGGLINGDICDSNTFLNYVLNQHSGSIFLFDSTRSTRTNDNSDSLASGNGFTSISTQSSQQSGTVSNPKHMVSIAVNDENITSSDNTSNINHKVTHSPCAILTNEHKPTTSGCSTNTASKYSQTISSISLHQDAKTNTGEFDDSDSSVSNSPQMEGNSVFSHCLKCNLEKSVNEESESEHGVVKTVTNFCEKCDLISQSQLCFPTVYCTKNCTVSTSKRDSINVPHTCGTHIHDEPCHNLRSNCTVSKHVIEHNAKTENIVNHCCNSVTKHGNSGSLICKATNDCGDRCINNNKRMHYIDIDRPYTCEICFKNYSSNTALINHTRYHRGERPYQCEICNKAFATNSHLVTHRRVHTGERPFQCQLCRRSFADRSAFVKHERTHGPNGSIIKRYKCEECGNAFVDSCGLKKHIRIHTGERPYRCSVCEKTFSTSSTFVAHKRIHSGERPYKCDQCNKMFITKSHLLTHRRTHTGEKPFTCHVCNRAFADGSSFRRHERLHTGENRHTCDVCGKGFPFDTSLAKHKQSHIPGSATYVYMV